MRLNLIKIEKIDQNNMEKVTRELLKEEDVMKKFLPNLSEDRAMYHVRFVFTKLNYIMECYNVTMERS